MERELPTIDLSGHFFLVDVAHDRLLNVYDPSQSIAFKDMEKISAGAEGTKYRFLFDAHTVSLYTGGNLPERLPNTVRYLEIPHQSVLDPMGRAQQTAIQSTTLPPGTSAEPLHHIAREIPRLNIFGTEFHFDSAYQVLRQVNDPTNTISFSQIKVFEKAGSMFLEFNTKTKTLAGVTHNEKPQDVQIYVMPTMDKIDPVMWEKLKIDPSQKAAQEQKRNAGKPRVVDDPPDKKNKKRR